ncbi:asparaginase precursor [Fusarium mexicanum]|uniref:Asparaginase n=1 Tax=Fusarium mexicanum TaxID=751941 RepID=A0A8H5JG66_9HYPO|nr:asparaginase precursor [Fusarium mexicanum]
MVEEPQTAPESLSARKRSKASEENEEERSKKRSRGRPRLDTRDETAQDRRRTQIRLAQRAYRNRKDTAITTLEDKVKDLEDANENMSKEFMNFFDFVLSQGMLEGAPEVARRLNDTTRKFLSLTRKSADDSTRDGIEDTPASEQAQEQVVSQPPGRHPSGSDSSTSGSGSGEYMLQHPPGFSVSQEKSLSTPRRPDATIRQQATPPLNLPYEIITMPTTDNASFPVYDTQTTISFEQNPFLQSPFPNVHSPTSYAPQERSFGRRLQRATLEAGLRLASMANPPPHRYAEVFGFCLLFEPRESIIRRISSTLARVSQESMFVWRYPFTNLGGAGTFFPSNGEAGGNTAPGANGNAIPLGNQGLTQHMKPHEMSGFSMGPFNPEVEAAKGDHIDTRMRMMYQGFEGDFFDADEVETYLRQRGIVIPANVDFIDAEIDMGSFDETPDLSGLGTSSSFFGTQQPPASSQAPYMPSQQATSDISSMWQSTIPTTIATTTASMTQASLMAPAMSVDFINIMPTVESTNPGQFGAGMGSLTDSSYFPRDWATDASWMKTKVTMDVNRLVAEMTSRAMEYRAQEQTTPRLKPRLAIHGGAGNIQRDTYPPEQFRAYRKALIDIVTRADQYMRSHEVVSEKSSKKLPSALDTATFAVRLLENNPLFNSGHGAVFTRDGVIELEASVMVSRGYKKRGVGVMGLRHVKNPILLARAMLEHGEDDLEANPRGVSSGDLGVPSAQGHTQLYGKAAEQLAQQYGLELVDPSYFFTQRRWDEHIRALGKEKKGLGQATWSATEYLPQGTCGAVALDQDGVICAATSTGGLTNKLTGRIGDTPTIGSGFWAEEWTEDGDPTGSSTWGRLKKAMTESGPSLVLSDVLRGTLADCFPTPLTYTPLELSGKRVSATRSIGGSGTGNGDSFLRTNALRTFAAMARWKPESGSKAVAHIAGPGGELERSAGDRWRRTGEGEGGIIGIESVVVRDSHGQVIETRSEVLMDFNCGGMFRAWIDDEGNPQMSIFSNEPSSNL